MSNAKPAPSAPLDDVMYTRYVRQKQERAREDIKTCRGTCQEAIEQKYLGRRLFNERAPLTSKRAS